MRSLRPLPPGDYYFQYINIILCYVPNNTHYNIQPPRCDPILLPPPPAVAADQSNIMGISLFLVCLCQLNNCNKSGAAAAAAARAVRTHSHFAHTRSSHTLAAGIVGESGDVGEWQIARNNIIHIYIYIWYKHAL